MVEQLPSDRDDPWRQKFGAWPELLKKFRALPGVRVYDTPREASAYVDEYGLRAFMPEAPIDLSQIVEDSREHGVRHRVEKLISPASRAAVQVSARVLEKKVGKDVRCHALLVCCTGEEIRGGEPRKGVANGRSGNAKS